MRLPSCLILLIAILSRFSLAAEPNASESRRAEPATGSIAGTVVPPDGAEIVLAGQQLQIFPLRGYEQPFAAVHFEVNTTIDEAGRFRFDGLPRGRYVVQPAESPDMPFFIDSSGQLELKAAEHLEGVNLRVTLGRQVRGRVVDRETGKGIESVEVIIVGDSQRKRRIAHTDEEGRFSSWSVPGEASAMIRQAPFEYLLPSAGDGRGQRSYSREEWPRIELDRAARIEARVVDEQGEPVPQARLDIQRATIKRIGAWTPVPEEADASGRFTVEQLEPSEPVFLRARSATAASETPLIIVPSEGDGPVDVIISEKRASRLSGQVVDRQGRPVPGAKILITGTHHSQQANTYRTHRPLSDQPVPVLADGSFETEALWPGDDYQLQVIAPGHGDLQTASVRGEPGKRHDFGPLTLDAFATFAGQVVDADDRPAPRAELRIALPPGSPQANGGLIGLACDEEGRFELPPMNLSGTLRIWARAGRATTNGPETFFPDLIQGPLKIVVSEEHAFRLAGEIVDRQGRPVRASVDVILQVERPEDVRRRPFRVPERRVRALSQLAFSLNGFMLNEEGAFLTGGLWPDQRYRLQITAEGYQPIESRIFSGRRGETADAGRFELRRTSVTLDGEVLDAAGQPVAGATVFNSGDAEQPLTATTDAAGRFRLEGLTEGPVCLLVRKPGFWPAGASLSTSDAGVQVRLIDEGRPRPESRLPGVDAASNAEDREVARRLLSELWELRHRIVPGDNSGGRAGGAAFAGNLIFQMAAIDRNEALRWSAEMGGAYDDRLHQWQINRMVNDGVDEAIERADVRGRDDSLKWMARVRLAAGDRDGAIRLLERARQADLRLEASGTEARFAISSQAEIGALAIAAGREDWGIGLINEAADRVEAAAGETDVQRGAVDAQTRALVASALATFDPQRSVQLWERSPPSRGGIEESYAIELASALAPHDLQAARRIIPAVPVKRLESGFVVESNSLIQLARRLARLNPDKALTLLDEVTECDRLEKAEALGRIAVALASQDSGKALDLIDQALALCFPVAGKVQDAIVEVRRAECGARIALLAQQAGYPDMRTVIAQVLALRLTPDEQSSVELRAEALINAARPLALLDREAARMILSGVPHPPSTTDQRAGESKLGKWLAAWVLVDVAQAEKLFYEVLANEGPRISTECVDSGLLPMIRLLGTSPEHREQTLFPTVRYWVSPPGDDD